jgi:putative ATP-dependent endonuclease of the OLD family
MLLRFVRIENFRGLVRLELTLDEMTVLIGENNCGKTTVLEAIRLCLSRSFNRKAIPFEDHDYHLPAAASRPGDAGPLRITLKFAEASTGEWPPELIQTLADAASLDAQGKYQVTLQVSSSYDASIRDFVSDWDFLDINERPNPRARRPAVLATFQNLFNVYYLTALRDAARDFGPRSTFWGPFLRNPAIPDQIKTQLEQELAALNAKILNADQRLRDVSTNLGKAQQVVTLGQTNTVTIDAVPTQVWDLLSRAQVNVAAVTGAPLPLLKHGVGTQSLASIFLFEAFLAAGLGNVDPLASSMLQIEEPEAHLHPSAIRSLWPTLTRTQGQKIVATHSGDLLSEVPLEAIRRLFRTQNGIQVSRLTPGSLTPDELFKVRFHVRSYRGELLFARVWLLHEGQTEYWLLTEAAKIAGLKLEEKGVRLVEYADVGIEPVIKLADQFGIGWHCLFDGDAEGQKNLAKASALLNGRNPNVHLSTIPAPDSDHFVCANGYGTIYEQNVNPQKASQITCRPGDPNYWPQVIGAQPKRFKVPCILKVVQHMEAQGAAAVPVFLQTVLQTAIALGGV